MNRKSGCGAAVLIVAGGLGYLAWRTTHPPVIGEIFAKLSPAVKAQRRAQVRGLEQQYKKIGRESIKHQHRPFTVIITEGEMNTILQDDVHTDKFALRDLRAGFTPGHFVLQGRVILKHFDSTATARGALTLEGGQVKCDIDSLEIAGWPAPSSWGDKLEAPVTKVLNHELEQAPGKLTHVELADKKLILQGVTR